jgi:lycopene cyclase domain-containing protein
VTYPIILVPFVLVTIAVTLATLAKPRFGRRMAASGIAAAVLVVLTAVFDNVMIAADLFRFHGAHTSGLTLGRAPVEDLAWPVAAALGLPALYLLLGREQEAA